MAYINSQSTSSVRAFVLGVTCVAVVAAYSPSLAHAERLKSLVDLEGVRPNQLVGYGVVVGLAGTGDAIASAVAVQSTLNLLKRLGARVNLNRLKLPNVAAVIVTAELPAFTAAGQELDVTVSSLGSAESLEGGTLVATPLKGPDLKVYAVAQGALSVGGFKAGGASGTRVEKNHVTVGRVPGGAIVEREVPLTLRGNLIRITLKQPDFTTAVRIADAIDIALDGPKAKALEAERLKKEAEAKALEEEAAKNKRKRGKRGKGAGAKPDEVAAEEKKTVDENSAKAAADGDASGIKEPEWRARAENGGSVMVRIPDEYIGRIPELMAELEALEVNPDIPTRVVVNERTGTVVLGDGVRIMPVAIAHGGLTVEVVETPRVSQPGAFSQGNTEVVANSRIGAFESRAFLTRLEGASLADVVKALNALGVSPRDLVAILQTLKASGALRGELEIQ